MTETERFYSKLDEILEYESKQAIIYTPGVLEILAEHWNNEVIDALEAEAEDDYNARNDTQ